MSQTLSPRRILAFTLRRLGPVVLISMLVGAVGYIVRNSTTDEWVSEAKVAFVEDTRFDYVDAERDRLVGHVEADARSLVAARDVAHVDFLRPSRETLLDVVVTASNPDVARDRANELADAIVEADRGVKRRSVDVELQARESQLAEITQDIDGLQTEMREQVEREAFAEANRFEGEPSDVERLTIQLREAQDKLYLATRYRNALEQRRLETEERITELQIDLDTIQSQTRVVRPALSAESPAGPTPTTVGLIAAISTLFVGAFVLALLGASRKSEP